MSRPAEFDRREAIEVAMNEIWRNGYEACSVKKISEILGITRSSFYNAFGSREALFKEALDAYATIAPDKMLGEARDDESIAALLTRLFREVCRVRAADKESRGCMAVNCIAELVSVDPELGPYLEKAVRAKRKRLKELLRKAAANGEIADQHDLDAKALAVLNLLAGVNLMAKVVRNEKELWTAARAGLNGLGLLARPEG